MGDANEAWEKWAPPAVANVNPHLEAAFKAGFAAGQVAALEDAAKEVDLSEFYDPDPRGQVSQECGHAETAAHRWLSARAVAAKDGGSDG